MSLNILLVDDSKIVRAVIIKTLKLIDIPIANIYEASNGKEALGVLKENWIDIVFTDINMPVMTGIEMIEEMSKDDILKTVPVVVISTEGSIKRIEDLRHKGIKAYIRKPFTPEQIKEVMEEIIGVCDGD